jgi:NADPH:quinone reductase-like Zn-dependent oxidoreductase
MKAAIIDALGQLPRFGDFAEPLAEGDEIVVTVTAASIKQLDRAIAAGTHYSSPRELPVIPGTDGVGRLPDGAQVYFAANRRPFGGMAELAPASWTVPLPVGMDNALAAAIVNPALGAWLPIMWRGGLRPGETVMVLGATGGTGRLAVRAARLLGAGRVVAAGRRLEQLAALDTDSIIDLRLPAQELRNRFAEEAERGIGVVVDYIWGTPSETLIDVLVKSDLAAEDSRGPDVRLVSVGAMAGPTITLPSAALRGSRLSILGSGTANFPPIDRLKEIVADILARASRGEIGLEVEEQPLAQVKEAWTAERADRRIVLRP